MRYAKRIGVEMNECRDREQPVFASGFGIPIHGKNPLRVQDLRSEAARYLKPGAKRSAAPGIRFSPRITH